MRFDWSVRFESFIRADRALVGWVIGLFSLMDGCLALTSKSRSWNHLTVSELVSSFFCVSEMARRSCAV